MTKKRIEIGAEIDRYNGEPTTRPSAKFEALVGKMKWQNFLKGRNGLAKKMLVLGRELFDEFGFDERNWSAFREEFLDAVWFSLYEANGRNCSSRRFDKGRGQSFGEALNDLVCNK
jgi:hypothetical protein